MIHLWCTPQCGGGLALPGCSPGRATPMTSRMDESPCARTYAASPSITLSGASGSANVAVPTCTADAPAIRNSSASSALVTPPAPMIGIETACAT